jgi:hypothetical protein
LRSLIACTVPSTIKRRNARERPLAERVERQNARAWRIAQGNSRMIVDD